jgi:uroporphyrinogen decarboxylase
MKDEFLKACTGAGTKYTPVWIMRQAGRYLPEYRKIRSKVDFLTLCKTPELAAEVTMQPVNILQVDAAILFSDILIPAEKMGLHLDFPENGGPVFARPVRGEADVAGLRAIEPEADVPYVLETIKILRKTLDVPLIGFAGAPFTVSTYMIEGGSSKNYLETKKMMYRAPALFFSLMDLVTETTIRYLTAQIRAGVQAVQLFDTWAGVLSPADYRHFVFPYVKKAIEAVKPMGVPVIYFVNDCAGILHVASKCGADVIGIDWRLDMGLAVRKLKGLTIQGNLDPCVLFSNKEHIRKSAIDILNKARNARGHVFNLGHGILPDTPVDNVKALVDAVHGYDRPKKG